jgi:hypothetical protein
MCLGKNITLGRVQVDMNGRSMYVTFKKYYNQQETEHGSFKLMVSGRYKHVNITPIPK